MELLWAGPAPHPTLGRACAAAGLTLARVARLPTGKGGVLCARRPCARAGPWIWVTPVALDDALAIEATLGGAVDVVSLAAPDVAARLVRAARLLEQPATPVPSDEHAVFASAAGVALAQQLARAAQTSMPVLLVGETGTGKEVAAHLVHAWSERKKRPFVAINCAAIPNELMEAELFGYTRGAFSGAVRDYDGRFAAGAGGTVFLDEVDDTPLAFQVKLLRVLEDRVVSRLGEDAERTVDFRLIAATNRDLHALIERGEFGDDLYERLAIVTVELPPLRARVDDIPPLVDAFVRRFYQEEPSARRRHQVRGVAPAALALLSRYPWPGNIRELRNTVYAALVHKRSGEELLLSDLPRRLLRPERGAGAIVDEQAVAAQVDAGRFDLVDAVTMLERAALGHALDKSGGNATGAARLLGRVGRGQARDPGGTVRAMAARLGLRERLRRR
ncbi:MAG: sigma 54-interacting transcriptional regulator [Deltaproteobacteria bacterium]|nr:sigma 54-interacting transcriptional regulator [Deltaproteobacteria bacterium]